MKSIKFVHILGISLMLASMLLFAFVAPAQAGEKVTICHAAGLDTTTHYIKITISVNAAFGQAGHFYENGTPRAGHEEDCIYGKTPGCDLKCGDMLY